MIGAQNFVTYLDWTFEYLRRSFGEDAVTEFWTKSLFVQRQAWPKLKAEGILGAAEHWGWQLNSEDAGSTSAMPMPLFCSERRDCRVWPSTGAMRSASARRPC
jgi:hypothetical protein